ncbi:hypothetical protein M501DRAFT_1019864 [Patellaria atrata CBS 101060]|uniref:Mitochondrial-processing peptidase subunit alpha n=1 Tax=Patellaria atrata CBS 101060 TaxID=1346257 RepID=A0A9P4S4Y9_9PEZI|nr:hypothetical protein M501DRAFT_1019864 [Patellaria atrata CBS 101060]
MSAKRFSNRKSRGKGCAHPSDYISLQDPVELDKITTLPNGVRVATEALPGPFSGVGVYVDAGSRYEGKTLQGVSHIMDRLAFKSTASRTADQMFEALETLGGNIQCASSRETIMYQAATFNSSVPDAVAVLAETVREPLITEDEVHQQLETASYEIGEIWSKPELILPELVHMAAYKDNTLGNPLLCPAERLNEIDSNVVNQYRKLLYTPERMVVAFAGVDHQSAVELAKKYFGSMEKNSGPVLAQYGNSASISGNSAVVEPSHNQQSSTGQGAATPLQEPSKLFAKVPFFKNLSTSATTNASVQTSADNFIDLFPPDLNASSHYTGGFLSLPRLPPPRNPVVRTLSHIHLAFEALPVSSPDIYALAILQTLLGGGGSFSAGGPGKGMYSRLYTNVLNQYGWVESCVSFNNSYSDSGLFGIAASCTPNRVSQMLEVMCRELQALTLDSGLHALRGAEVQRAKNQLKSSLLMNLESRMVELEDLGRQVQVHGKRFGVKRMCSDIDNVTAADLKRVARQVFGGLVENRGKGSGAPTVVLQEGEEEGVETKDLGWAEIQERISRWKLGRR